jgi:hypothetical protein
MATLARRVAKRAGKAAARLLEENPRDVRDAASHVKGILDKVEQASSRQAIEAQVPVAVAVAQEAPAAPDAWTWPEMEYMVGAVLVAAICVGVYYYFKG